MKKRRLEDRLLSAIMAIIVMMVLGTIIMSTGCSMIESAGGRTEISATGGPGALLSKIADLQMNGTLQTTPGGFTIRNNDPGIGAISNEDGGVNKDVDIYIQKVGPSGKNKYMLYRGPAEVQTPGWIKIWNEETGSWEKIKTERWIRVDRLESIHFESPFTQEVTLRLRISPENVQEIRFNTSGRKQYGSNYKRINLLFIRLPESHYRFEIFSYTGEWVFKSAEGQPYLRSIYINGNPVDTKVGNTWIGWKLIL